jgi:4-hydroxy-tetrahydrodipicolinate synthase
MKEISLAGSFVALVTPFNQRDQVDYGKIEELVEYHIANGTAGIVPCGTTGEASTLSHEEHRKIIDVVVRSASGRIPVLAGTGSNCTKEAIALTKHACDVGADGVLIVTPYYNRPTQEGIYRHYEVISQAVPGCPIVLYSIQGRTGVNIEPKTVQRLSRIPNIIGIKEASGNLNQMSSILHITEGSFQLTSGDDALTLPVLSIGGVGVISVLANIMPRQVVRMIQLYNDGRNIEAGVLHRHLMGITSSLFIETNPVPVKTAMAMLGRISGRVRLPLCHMSPESDILLSAEMKLAGLLPLP